MFNIYRNRITGGTKFLVNFQFTIKSNWLPFPKKVEFLSFSKNKVPYKNNIFIHNWPFYAKKLSVQKDAIIKRMGKRGNIYFEILQNKRMKRRKNLL